MGTNIGRDLYSKFIDNPLGRVSLLLLVGFFTMSANIYIEGKYILNPILKGILDSIPTGLLSAALISWILEAKDIRYIISKTFKESIYDFTDEKLFSKDVLSNIIRNALAKYYGLKEPLPQNNILDFYKDELLVHIGSPYAKDAKVVIELRIEKDKLYWVYNRECKIESLLDKETHIDIPVMISTIKAKGMEKHIWFDGDYIKIDGQNVLSNEEASKHIRDEGKYSHFSYTHKLSVKPGVPVDLKTRLTHVEDSTGHILYHLLFPFPVNGLDYHMAVNGPRKCEFLTFAPTMTKKAETTTDTTKIITYKGWITPGNSLTVTVIPAD